MSLPRACKGALEVVASCDTRRGSTDKVVPKDTVGYVLAKEQGGDFYLIYWIMPRQYKGDWRRSAHPIDDVRLTGRRG